MSKIKDVVKSEAIATIQVNIKVLYIAYVV